MYKIILAVSMIAIITGISSCKSSNEKNDDPSNDEPVINQTRAAVHSRSFDVTGKDTITLESGLKYILIEEGEGKKPDAGKSISVHYTGYLSDGSKFDSSVDRGEPLTFPIGTGQVIKGWDEGLALLNTGSRARLIIPASLGYGTEGYPPLIPPDATLIFDVELLKAE